MFRMLRTPNEANQKCALENNEKTAVPLKVSNLTF